MIVFINRDTIAGALLALAGFFIAIYAYLYYPIGQISRMGPGMFPFMMGIALLLVSGGIVAKSFLNAREAVAINVRATTVVLGALAAFALMVKPLGAVPATMALLLISSAAVPARRLLRTLLFSSIVTAAIVFIFAYLVGINLKLFGWSP